MNQRHHFFKKASNGLLAVAGFLYVMCLLAAVVLQAPPSEIQTVFFGAAAITVAALVLRLKSKVKADPELYRRIMYNRVFCTLDELSAAVGKSVPQIVEEIRILSLSGNLGGLYLSIEDNKLFASKEAYSLYLRESGRIGLPGGASRPKAAFSAQSDTVRQLQQFLVSVKAEMQKMDDEAVEQQTTQLCEQAEQLIDWLQNHPESGDGVKRFTGYYLPTTLKLLKAYNDVDDQKSSVSDEIQSNIIGFLKKINSAFQTLRDNLLQNVAMDISAEISAMNVILNQDGLQYESPLMK